MAEKITEFSYGAGEDSASTRNATGKRDPKRRLVVLVVEPAVCAPTDASYWCRAAEQIVIKNLGAYTCLKGVASGNMVTVCDKYNVAIHGVNQAIDEPDGGIEYLQIDS